MKRYKRALVLAPHTDDGELGCGGTISKLVEQGTEVFYTAFSTCKQSVPAGFSDNILTSEVKAATRRLGIKEDSLFILDYEVRNFNFKRQNILQDMIDIKKEVKPDLIFMPLLQDIHQDHKTIAEEGLRAFKLGNIFCYEMPWNNLSFNTNCFVELSEKHIQSKINSLSEYKSQGHRPYTNENFIRSLATMRGVQISKQYAESFEAIRMLF